MAAEDVVRAHAPVVRVAHPVDEDVPSPRPVGEELHDGRAPVASIATSKPSGGRPEGREGRLGVAGDLDDPVDAEPRRQRQLERRGPGDRQPRAPPWTSSCASRSPVVPDPIITTSAPGRRSRTSIPCTAQAPLGEDGDLVGQVVDRKTLCAGLTSDSANPPGALTPRDRKFSQKRCSPRALLAVPTCRGVVDSHPLAGLEMTDAAAHLAHHAHALVSRGQRELGEEPAFMQVQVGAAHTGQPHVDDDLSITRSRPRHLPDGELAWSVVDQGAHQCSWIDATAASWLRM